MLSIEPYAEDIQRISVNSSSSVTREETEAHREVVCPLSHIQ